MITKYTNYSYFLGFTLMMVFLAIVGHCMATKSYFNPSKMARQKRWVWATAKFAHGLGRQVYRHGQRRRWWSPSDKSMPPSDVSMIKDLNKLSDSHQKVIVDALNNQIKAQLKQG